MIGHVERFNPAVQAIKDAVTRRGNSVDRHYARSGRFRRACRMLAWSLISRSTIST